MGLANITIVSYSPQVIAIINRFMPGIFTVAAVQVGDQGVQQKKLLFSC
jgi:hypothetical protein